MYGLGIQRPRGYLGFRAYGLDLGVCFGLSDLVFGALGFMVIGC